jgi:peroxiredoxin
MAKKPGEGTLIDIIFYSTNLQNMKKEVFRLLIWVALPLFFACAGEKDNKKDAGAPSEAAFVANPQPVAEQPVTTLSPGDVAPDFRLPGVDGKFYSLADFAGAEALVIIFTCNHCPTAQAYEDRIIAFVNDYKNKGVATVAISPNSPLGLLDEECGYSDLHDDFSHMVIRAQDRGFNFPYLYDGDNQAISIQYGPVATPHAFVFDKARKLTYVGRIDGSEKPGTAQAEDLRAAVDATLAGQPVANPVTKTFGCSVKWGWKLEYTEKFNQEWAARPVTLEELDEAEIRALIKNDTDKLRLINVWATWCGPCVIEYPDLVTIHRMFSGRDFEFISISADKLAQKDKALKFLTSKNSALQNFIFAKDDQYALIEAVDPNWNGALPYTLLVEPGGNIIYAHQGTIDPPAMKKLIVEHPMIGRYY